MRQKTCLFLITIFGIVTSSFSQVSVSDSAISTAIIYGTYSYEFPGGDLAKRFGAVSAIGGGFMVKTKSNWLFSIEGKYLFGGNVKNKDSLLKGISTPDGFVIDVNGYYADIYYYERGFSFYGKFGKIIKILAPNPNCGFTIMAGAGFLQDKIRISNPGNSAPQVSGDYKKGYDRLNNGFSVNASLGYLFLSNSRLLNFWGGFEFTQAWTAARRNRDFDTGVKDAKKYSSQWYGLKVCWMIPLYKRSPNPYYMY
jgi:hypothetical protein